MVDDSRRLLPTVVMAFRRCSCRRCSTASCGRRSYLCKSSEGPSSFPCAEHAMEGRKKIAGRGFSAALDDKFAGLEERLERNRVPHAFLHQSGLELLHVLDECGDAIRVGGYKEQFVPIGVGMCHRHGACFSAAAYRMDYRVANDSQRVEHDEHLILVLLPTDDGQHLHIMVLLVIPACRQVRE